MVRITRTYDTDLIKAQNHEHFDVPLKAATLADAAWWVARDGAKVVGFAGIYDTSSEGVWLVRCAVAETHRRQGIAARFMRKRVAHWRMHMKGDLYTYVAGSNYGSHRNCVRNGGLVPYKVADGFVYYFRAR